jgi:hypothetical protein
MDRAAKKAKKRLKREQKRRQIHKQSSISPFRVVETASRVVECRMNADWAEKGMMQVIVLREARGLGLCFASFLIDTWCMGLKDAFAKFGILQEDYDDVLQRADRVFDGGVVRIDEAEAAKWVSAGIRFAQRNGFRLFADVMKCTSFLRGIAPEAADVTMFGFEVDGQRKLHFMGPMDDLRKHLATQSVQDFLARPDVVYTSEVRAGDVGFEDEDDFDEGFDADEDDAEMDESTLVEALHRTAHRIAQAVHSRLPAGDPLTEDDLVAAATALMVGSSRTMAGPQGGIDNALLDRPANEVVQHFTEETIRSAFPPDRQETMLRAVGLVREFFMSFDSQGEMLKALDPALEEPLPPLIESDGSPSPQPGR